jgi:hypothetical protein
VVSLSAAADGEISGLVFPASSGLISASRRCLFVAVSVRGGVLPRNGVSGSLAAIPNGRVNLAWPGLSVSWHHQS